ncbi:MAG: hypothetical protein FWG20_05710, partial [Candidatus Cloacimonetes bacterium]|nr:hypothetical protein [Candidatus Cloacimonadota bacterium]
MSDNISPTPRLLRRHPSPQERGKAMFRTISFFNRFFYIKKVLLLWAGFILMTSLCAYSIFDGQYGSEISHLDARTAALGGSGVAGGANLLDSSLNPANLYFMNKDHKYEVQFAHIVTKNSENRAFPLWNFFDSYIDESTYARNENFYNDWAFSL